MTAPSALVRAAPRRDLLADVVWPAAMLAGFAAAVALRVAIGGVAVAQSRNAGLVFAGTLVALALAAGVHVRWSGRALLAGVAGGLLLCVPVVVTRAGILGAHRPGGSYAGWAVVVAVVATAEEVFLRGAVYDAVSRRHGVPAAVVVGAVLFAVLHVPVYGLGVVPLDLAVGLWLGALRAASGSLLAPVAAHVTADLAGWWLL